MTEFLLLPIQAVAPSAPTAGIEADGDASATDFCAEDLVPEADAERAASEPEARPSGEDALQALIEDLCGISSAVPRNQADPAVAALRGKAAPPAAAAPTEATPPEEWPQDAAVESQVAEVTSLSGASEARSQPLHGGTQGPLPQDGLTLTTDEVAPIPAPVAGSRAPGVGMAPRAQAAGTAIRIDAATANIDAPDDSAPPRSVEVRAPAPQVDEAAPAAQPATTISAAAAPTGDGTPTAPAEDGAEIRLAATERMPLKVETLVSDLSGAAVAIAQVAESGLPDDIRGPKAAAIPVPRQIAQALVTARDQLVEIALAPEELGRIRMIVAGPEHTPHVTIWVERPEVLEQLRRNMAFLQECFGDAGMEEASFEFQGGPHPDARDGQTPAAGRPSDLPMADLAAPVAAAWTPTLVPTRLDIRI